MTTPPADEAFREDIRLALEAGFNGARLHQKVFEERMLFWADLHGYLTWGGEFGDWGGVSGMGADGRQPAAHRLLHRRVDRGRRPRHQPSLDHRLVPPLNETHQVLHDRLTQLDDVTQAMYDATKLADPSRPVLDASGYSHRVRGADVYDSHSYEQDPARFRAEQSGLADGRPHVNRRELGPDEMPFADGSYSLAYAGQPYFVSEYGGIWWNEQERARPPRPSAPGATPVSPGGGTASGSAARRSSTSASRA